jgi:signal transduction histidine kinase
MIDRNDDLFKAIEAVRQIPIVPTMLEVICQTTGMGFAAIARVTQDRWLACSVRDEVHFGLTEGDELQIETTLCNEIRDQRKPIIIDHVDQDEQYQYHHTPKMYGLQSYISFPILLKDGTFFGTLCAIDSGPALINNSKIIGLFTMFTDLLAFHLQSLDLLERSYQTNTELHQQNRVLTHVNQDLDTFVHTASHDLKSPISSIEGLLDILAATIAEDTVNWARVNQIIGLLKSTVKRFGVTIKDLTTFVEAENYIADDQIEEIRMEEVIESVKQDLTNLIEDSQAEIQVLGEEKLKIDMSKMKLKSIVTNLISNAIKYRSPERRPEVIVKAEKREDKIHLSVTDNGLGIPSDKQDKIFTMFKRLHNHVEGSGLGLYIVKRMIDASKGQIQVNSILNQGTTFTVIL